MAPISLPCPAFEGFEKRLILEFQPSAAANGGDKAGLRLVKRAELDSMLADAECTIVSLMSNAEVDAYVLSESSLFVFDRRFVLKTCGTTKLLKSIPKMLQAAASVGLEPSRAVYSRGSFLFPEAQHFPHRSFDEEVQELDGKFSFLPVRRAHVLGDMLGSRKWHVYVASLNGTSPAAAATHGLANHAARAGHQSSGAGHLSPAVRAALPPTSTVTVEVCMTDLHPEATKYYFKSNGFGDAAEVTEKSGISGLIPHSRIDDFLFDPCGYSMNALDGEIASTVHITPEDGFSYASFEVMGPLKHIPSGKGGVLAPETACALTKAVGGDLSSLVTRVAQTFLPGCLTVAVHVTNMSTLSAPETRRCVSSRALSSYPAAALSPSANPLHSSLAASSLAATLSPLQALSSSKSWARLSSPEGYVCRGTTCQMLPGDAMVSFTTFDCTAARAAAAAAPAEVSATALVSPGLRVPLPMPEESVPPAVWGWDSSDDDMADNLSSGSSGRFSDDGSPMHQGLSGKGPRVVLDGVLMDDIMADGAESSDDEMGVVCRIPGATRSATPVDKTAVAYGSAVASVVAGINPVQVQGGEQALDDFILTSVKQRGLESAFYVMDAAAVLKLFSAWQDYLPRVQPFYAVKCNPYAPLLSLLASLGAGFDVASVAEMEAVAAACGGSLPDPSRLIFANPCKLPAHMRFASDAGVRMTTFDSEAELQKLARHYPDAQAVLRIRADDVSAQCALGVKYGAEPEEWGPLLSAAKRLGVNVVGVAFHVGSGAKDPTAFADAVTQARQAFDLAESLGLPKLTLLDIGGGFTSAGLPGNESSSGLAFAAACQALNGALDQHFPEGCGVRVISEPGRFFAESSFTLATRVFGVRSRKSAAGAPVMQYWVDDGIYGSMNCLLYDHATLSARPVRMGASAGAGAGGKDGGEEKVFPSTVFGPTCDGLDTILEDVPLPKLGLDDWLVGS